MRSFWHTTACLCLAPLVLAGQAGRDNTHQNNIRAEGHFLSPSTQIGLPTQYLLVAAYPLDKEVFFPDSTYSFRPFEWVSMSYHRSVLDQGIVRDSVWYSLASFETEKVQKLRLPIFVRQTSEKDTLKVWAATDSIRITDILPLTGQEPLKESLTVRTVDLDFNWFYFWLITAAASLVLGGLVWYFWQPILRKIQLHRLRRDFLTFEQHFGRKWQEVRQNPQQGELVEELLFIAKHYWEKLDASIPYSKLSTKELMARSSEKPLTKTLQTLDTHIYGRQIPTKQVMDHINHIEDLSLEKYQIQKAKWMKK